MPIVMLLLAVATVVYLSYGPIGEMLRIRSKAWLAARVWLQLARLPPPASRVRRSRRLRDTLAAAPGLLAHASVTETVKRLSDAVGPKLRHTVVQIVPVLRMPASVRSHST